MIEEKRKFYRKKHKCDKKVLKIVASKILTLEVKSENQFSLAAFYFFISFLNLSTKSFSVLILINQINNSIQINSWHCNNYYLVKSNNVSFALLQIIFSFSIESAKFFANTLKFMKLDQSKFKLQSKFLLAIFKK